MEQFKEPAAGPSQAALQPGRVPTASSAAETAEEASKNKACSSKEQAPPDKPKMQPRPKAAQAAVQVYKVDDDDGEVAPAKKQKLRPTEPAGPPPFKDEPEDDELEEPAGEEPPGDGDEEYDSEVDSELPSSWRRTLRRFGVDAHARLQLTLLAEENYSSASEIVWKLTKERESPIENTSAFIAKCVTSSRRQMFEKSDRWMHDKSDKWKW